MSGGTGGTEQAQTQLSQQSAGQSAQTFGATFPGLQMAESYYNSLASGNPTAIASAVGPSVSQIAGNTAATKQQILQTTPRGGEQNLALEQADISKASQVGNLETSAYTSSFPALASLASSGMGISVNELANALSGYQSIGQEQSAGKASTMGFLGSLAGGAGTAAGGL